MENVNVVVAPVRIELAPKALAILGASGRGQPVMVIVSRIALPVGDWAAGFLPVNMMRNQVWETPVFVALLGPSVTHDLEILAVDSCVKLLPSGLENRK